MLPSRLVFCGGGTRCLVFLQTLVELEEKRRLINVKEYWGTSAGALLASLCAMTKSAKTVKTIMFDADYQKFRNIDVSNILSINTTWGLDNGASLVKEIERLFENIELGSCKKTLGDISGLNIIVSDLSRHETIVCNSATYPDLRIVDAIRASMSLPFMFCPYKHPVSGNLWVDGAVRANFPWDVLPDDKARSEALGFTFEKSWIGGAKTFMEYIFSMIHFDEPKKIAEHKRLWPNNILWYPSPPYPPWFVRFNADDFHLVESMGQRIAEQWLSANTTATTSTSCPERLVVPVLSGRRCTPQLDRHQDPLNEASDIQKPLPNLESVFPQSQTSVPASRRWSV